MPTSELAEKFVDVTATTEVRFDADPKVGIHWVHFFDSDGGEHVWSKMPLPDPDDYFGGWKAPIVKSWGKIKRACSDWRGEYESTSTTWTVADEGRQIRNLAAALNTRWLKGRNVIQRTATDIARRLRQIPRTIFRGITTKAKPIAPLLYEISAQDWFVSLFRVGQNEQQIPKATITRVTHANAPTDVLNRAIPVIYGVLSDEGSAAAPPTITGDPVRGAFTSGGFWNAGFGNRVSDVLAGDIVVAPLVASSGGTLSADVPGATYGAIVTGVDAMGRESDPTPFFTDADGSGFPAGVPTASVDGTQKITVTWLPAGGAVKYRVYLGYYYFGFRPVQFIEVDDPTVTVEFTASPAWTAPVDATVITPGANVIQFSQFWYYFVTAIMPDGETGRSVEVFGITRAYRRPLRIQWLEVPDALGYRIYRRGAVPNSYDRKWEVAGGATTFFDDDLLDTGATIISGAPSAVGVVPVIYVGTKADSSGFPWHQFLICGHAIKSIISWYSGGVRVHPGTAGVDWAVPGHTNYATYFPNTGATQYLDEGSQRGTYVFVRGPYADFAIDGSKPITLNLEGTEDVGDSSGDVIVSGPQIYKHALKNYLVGDYRTGAPLDSPTFEDDPDLPKIDEPSFDDAEEAIATRIEGGYPHAFIMGADGERVSLATWVARFNINNDVNSRFNRKTQFGIVAESDSLALLDAAEDFTQIHDIKVDTFDLNDEDERHENVVPYAFLFDYVQGAARDSRGRFVEGGNYQELAEVADDESIEEYGVRLESPRVELMLVRLAIVAQDIASRRLLRTKDPPRLVSFTVGLRGLNVELGDIILVTHRDGITLGSTAGYERQPIRVMRHEFDPDTWSVALEGYDVGYLFDGGFILGDETTLPTLWTSATATQRRYGFLGDEVTETFSDGAPIKRLR